MEISLSSLFLIDLSDSDHSFRAMAIQKKSKACRESLFGWKILTGWYNPAMLVDLGIGDIVRLRKPHPCGGYEWQVVRLGADIGIVCLNCGRRVMLDRRSLKNRIKVVVSRAEEIEKNND